MTTSLRSIPDAAARPGPSAAPVGAPAVARRPGHGRRVAGRVVHYLILVALLGIMLGPIIWPMVTSMKSLQEDVFGPHASFLPHHWSLAAYTTLFHDIPVLKYMGNSLTLALMAVTSQVVFSTAGGYMLSRKHWRGRWLITILVLSAIIFPFESIMLSLYSQIQALGLLDTLIGVWLPGFVGVFNVLIMRTAFASVPQALEEAAFIDGAGEFRRFFSIFLPAAKGSIVIVVLTSFIGAWDDFLWPLMTLQSGEKFTLTLGLASLQSQFGFDVRVDLAGAVVALIPIVIIFLACQRFFFRGVEEGGLKF